MDAAATGPFVERRRVGSRSPSPKALLEALDHLARDRRAGPDHHAARPGRRDRDEGLAECEWIVDRLGVDVPLHFTAFHPDFKMREVPPTPPETLGRARAIALKAGQRHVRTGEAATWTTYCPGCGEALVTRDRYRIDRFALSDFGQ
jgi:pyruvate formate lyase activating enzyme